MPGVRRMVLAHSGRRRKAGETGMRAREGWRSRGQRSGPDHKGPRRSGGEPGVAGAFAEARARTVRSRQVSHRTPLDGGGPHLLPRGPLGLDGSPTRRNKGRQETGGQLNQ